MNVEISPSLLPLRGQPLEPIVESLINLGIKRIHLDVIDGKFCPYEGLNIDVVHTLLSAYGNQCALDVHLMVESPDQFISHPSFANANIIYVHQQTQASYQQALLHQIQSLDVTPGLVINPDETSLQLNDAFQAYLVMGVVPGQSGQARIPGSTEKAFALKAQHPHKHVTLDGGVDEPLLLKCHAQQALDCCVMGNAIFKHAQWQTYLKQLLATMK